MNKVLESQLKNIKLLAMDFDGVHTDGHVYVNQDGVEFVKCSRKDGLGIEQLKEIGVQLVVISKETNRVVEARCKKINVQFYNGVYDAQGKAQILQSLTDEQGITMEEVAYIGDDTNDKDAFELAGVSVTVADGHESLIESADIVLTRKGGDHAIRELCDLIIAAK